MADPERSTDTRRAILAGVLACLLAFTATFASVQLVEQNDGDNVAIVPSAEAALGMRSLSEREVMARVAERPEWRVGDAWLVRLEPGFACWLVVGEVTDAGYAQGTSCEGDDVAAGARIAANDLPYAGTFDRDFGRITGDAGTVRLYDWPLEDGKTWRTPWFGETATVRAAFVEELVGPLGTEPGFALSMSLGDSDTPFLLYDYVPSLRWWSEFRYESGERVVVEDAQRGWDGRVVMVEAVERMYLWSNFLMMAPADANTFEIEPADGALLVQTTTQGRHWLELRVRDPSGGEQARESRTDAGVGSSYSFSIVEEPEPGTWTVDVIFGGSGRIDTRIHALRIDVRSL
jgi:hypothetical protein